MFGYGNPLTAIAFDGGNYASRKVGNDKVNGVVVSTAYSSDMGYETAIIQEGGNGDVHPVERYDYDREDAEIGHKRWCDKMIYAETITDIGYPGWESPYEVTLKRSV